MDYAVIGLGNFGKSVCIGLMNEGMNVLAIDNDQAVIEDIKSLVTEAVCINSISEEALIKAGIGEIDCAVVCIGEDMLASILTTLLLKKIGVNKIIARSNSNEHKMILEMIGAQVVMPEVEMGEKLAKRLANKNILNYIELGDDYLICELLANESIIGKSLIELNLRKLFNVNIIAIKKRIPTIDQNGNNIFVEKLNNVPDPYSLIEDRDVLVIIGTEKDINKLKEALYFT